MPINGIGIIRHRESTLPRKRSSARGRCTANCSIKLTVQRLQSTQVYSDRLMAYGIPLSGMHI